MFSVPPAPRTDPASVAFVIRCFLLQVVDAEELRQWAEEALAGPDECPIFVEGLAEFDGRGEEVYRMLGFVPDRVFTPEQDAALTGIAYERGRQPADGAPDEVRARAALGGRPDVAEEFRCSFGFLTAGD